MKINDLKVNNNNEISMGFDTYLGEDNYLNNTYLDKINSVDDVYLNLDDIDKR